MIKFVTTASFTAVVLASLIAEPAMAKTVDTAAATTSVSYADLDLTSAAGQAKMHSRMNAAARRVCGFNFGERDLGQVSRQNACVATAMNGAQVELAAATTSINSTQRVAVGGAADSNVPGRAR